MIRTSTHKLIVVRLEQEIHALKNQLEKAKIAPVLREFTLVFKNGRKVKIVGTTVDNGKDGGFAVKTLKHGEDRVAHWFAERPVEWSSTWLS